MSSYGARVVYFALLLRSEWRSRAKHAFRYGKPQESRLEVRAIFGKW